MQQKPGDKFVRRPRMRRFYLKRVLGIPALFSAGYGDVGSSIYYALGIVAIVALGATPIVLAIAGIIYVFNALSYAEGTALFPEAGGSSSFARHAFNDMWGFVAGWALMLSYITTISLSAFSIPPYLGYFWEPLKDFRLSAAVSIGIVGFLMYINVIGIRESSRVNISFILVDIVTQLSLIVLGFFLILLPQPGVLFHNMFGAGNWPTTTNLIFGIALAALAFTGVETISQMSQEATNPATQAPRAYILMIFIVLVIFSGISLVALSAMTPQQLGDPINGWARDPVAGIAYALPAPLNRVFGSVVSILAATILLTASNAGMIGISRLSFSLGIHRGMPSALSRIHHRFRTPYISIILFSVISTIVLAQGFYSVKFFANLGALYAFGSLLTFALAHASIIGLRMKRPRLKRPFKLGWGVNIKGREVPLTAILGLLTTGTVWVLIIIMQPYSRYMGLAWMVLGLLFYSIYRWRQHLPLMQGPDKTRPRR